MPRPDSPAIEEVLAHAGAETQAWYESETERRRAERIAKETAPREFHGTTLVVGHMYDLTVQSALRRGNRRRNLLYLGTTTGPWRTAAEFVRIAPDGPVPRKYAPWNGDVQAAVEVQPTPEQQAFIDEYMATKERHES